MKRPLKPAPPTRSRFPKLGAAWRILLGAAPVALSAQLAHADATTPPPSEGAPACPGGQKKPPEGEKRPEDPPVLGGKPMPPKTPDPPDPPNPPKKPIKDRHHLGGAKRAPERATIGDARRAMIHPHDFNEPCFFDGDEDA
jgi:hypothetical protein